MKLRKHQYTNGSYVPMFAISVPGYITALVPTDKTLKYFHLCLLPKNMVDPSQIITLGGPFAIEEFNLDFIKTNTNGK